MPGWLADFLVTPDQLRPVVFEAVFSSVGLINHRFMRPEYFCWCADGEHAPAHALFAIACQAVSCSPVIALLSASACSLKLGRAARLRPVIVVVRVDVLLSASWDRY
jgi:hypothetical protein